MGYFVKKITLGKFREVESEVCFLLIDNILSFMFTYKISLYSLQNNNH